MKRAFWLAGLALLLLAVPGTATAGWWVDRRLLHMSAHGTLSCRDCHEDISLEQHPRPVEVRKSRREFFQPDDCLACHDTVTDHLASGRHGRRRGVDAARYAHCIRCHRPHRQSFVDASSRPTGADTCARCHDPQQALPEPAAEDRACIECHQKPDPASPEGAARIRGFCLYCHAAGTEPAQQATGQIIGLMDPASTSERPHAAMACTTCHPEAARFGHHRQQPADCQACHARHDEKSIGDAHLLVECGACHLRGVDPVREPVSRRVTWTTPRRPGQPLEVHRVRLADREEACRRCHRANNSVGAASMVLPAKSILCMPCHPATFSAGDFLTLIGLGFLAAGLAGLAAVVFTVSGGGRKAAAAAGRPQTRKARQRVRAAARILRAIFWDVLLQRRLYRRSRLRWGFHALIFMPLAFRFTWGMVGLLGSLWYPDSSWVWELLDKNRPLGAFLFDLTGLMLLAGVGLALLRGSLRNHFQPPGLPRHAPLALILLGAIAAVGFVLEGMRIAMSGWPQGSAYALAGYALSRLLGDRPLWIGLYGIVWYLHAALVAGFVAILPFTRMFHIILAPLSLALSAVAAQDHARKGPRRDETCVSRSQAVP